MGHSDEVWALAKRGCLYNVCALAINVVLTLVVLSVVDSGWVLLGSLWFFFSSAVFIRSWYMRSIGGWQGVVTELLRSRKQK